MNLCDVKTSSLREESATKTKAMLTRQEFREEDGNNPSLSSEKTFVTTDRLKIFR